MAVDINAALDSALANAQVIQGKLDNAAATNKDLQEKVGVLSNQVNTLQSQVNLGVLQPEQEKKFQDLANLLEQLSK